MFVSMAVRCRENEEIYIRPLCITSRKCLEQITFKSVTAVENTNGANLYANTKLILQYKGSDGRKARAVSGLV